MIFAELSTTFVNSSSDNEEREKRKQIINELKERVYTNPSILPERMREYASKLPRGKNATSGQLRVLAEC